MKATYSKNYFEKYAALSLTKVLGVSADFIIHADRPDLRIPKYNFGIEVTQALTPIEAVADIKKSLYSYLQFNPFDHDENDLNFVIKKINNAIERKEIKSKNYDIYKDNGLYIFSHCHNLNKLMLFNYFQQLDLTNSFYQHFFINCVDCLYHFHCQSNEIKRHNYSLLELTNMNDKALEFEKHCHKERREIVLPK